MGEPKDQVSSWVPWSMASLKVKMVTKMTRCARFQVRASEPPTWRAKDVMGYPRPPMGPEGPLLVRQGDIVLDKEQTNARQHGSEHTSNLPRFGPPQGIRPYSYFSGLMVE